MCPCVVVVVARWSRKNRGLPPNPPKVEIDYRTGYIRSHLRSPSGRVRWPTRARRRTTKPEPLFREVNEPGPTSTAAAADRRHPPGRPAFPFPLEDALYTILYTAVWVPAGARKIVFRGGRRNRFWNFNRWTDGSRHGAWFCSSLSRPGVWRHVPSLPPPPLPSIWVPALRRLQLAVDQPISDVLRIAHKRVHTVNEPTTFSGIVSFGFVRTHFLWLKNSITGYLWNIVYPSSVDDYVVTREPKTERLLWCRGLEPEL